MNKIKRATRIDSKYALCPGCGRRMLPGGACDIHAVFADDTLELFWRVPNTGAPCHDCNAGAAAGACHHWGCDSEPCPRCGGQIIEGNCSCGTFTGLGGYLAPEWRAGWETARHMTRPHPVDLRQALPEIPVEDWHEIRRNATVEEPNARAYWEGYNACVERIDKHAIWRGV